MPRTHAGRTLLGLLVLLGSARHVIQAQSTPSTPNEQLARDLLNELININTTHDHGSTTPAAQSMARRLVAAGFPDSDVQIVGPADSRNQNLVARYRGTGKRRPILLLAHLDVVEALPSDWSVDPFTLLERDGYFYGRGTSDIKDMAALFVAALIRLKQEKFVPDRDVILALTAGEESGGDYNGVQWLLANRRVLIDAAYCINGDAGDPLERNRIPFARNVEASEKVYHDFQLVVTNPGGHSSLPTPDNAIYRLAAALERLGNYAFPVMLNDITRAYLDRAAATMPPATAGDMHLAARGDSAAQARLSASSPFFNAQLRTTCVATRLEGGHANNALPQTARAVVNCRMLPGHDPDSVLAALRRVVADSAVQVTPLDTARPSPPSPLVAEVLDPVTRISAQLWPGVPVIPNMETGATDGLYLRNAGMPVYGVSGVFLESDDIRAHGKDERIGVAEYYTGAEFTYRLVKALSASGRR
ncbi:MAG TPA: M20/M25/M40 family metallo-hydrolase [Gemmatimonadales bacterium]|nr:M20/M25/M40 family metallo-hydrolase [Gemmatimonadales bacterium]